MTRAKTHGPTKRRAGTSADKRARTGPVFGTQPIELAELDAVVDVLDPHEPREPDEPAAPERAAKPRSVPPRPPPGAKPAPRPAPAKRTSEPRLPAPPPSVASSHDDSISRLVIAEQPQLEPLSVAIQETAAHLPIAQRAVAAAGHLVAGTASGPRIEQLHALVRNGSVDCLIVGVPGGEPLVETALAQPDATRPVVIAACNVPAVDAIARATTLGADLVVLRPHDVERLAPALLAASRLLHARRAKASEPAPPPFASSPPPVTPAPAEATPAAATSAPAAPTPATPTPASPGAEIATKPVPRVEPEESEVEIMIEAEAESAAPDPVSEALEPPAPVDEAELAAALDDLEPEDEPEARALVPLEDFQRAVALELDQSRRSLYPVAIAVFAVDLEPPPPPGVSGILRARCGNALIHALRDDDVATELPGERFLVLMPYTELSMATDVARRILAAAAEERPVMAAGETFAPQLVGAIAGAAAGQPATFEGLLREATRALDEAMRDGAELAVPM